MGDLQNGWFIMEHPIKMDVYMQPPYIYAISFVFQNLLESCLPRNFQLSQCSSYIFSELQMDGCKDTPSGAN